MSRAFQNVLFRVQWRSLAAALLLALSVATGSGQSAANADPTITQRIEALTKAIDRVEGEMQQSQRDLAELRHQLASLQSNLSLAPTAEPPEPASALREAVASLRENQAMDQSQIATLAQSKIESVSKYPVKLTGMILMTGVVSTQRVDVADAPSLALSGPGATAATARQSVLGLSAVGPHVFGGNSFADIHFDFGGTGSSAYSAAMLRLRTAHAALEWARTRAFFAFDHSFLNPDNPTSLVAVAEPALAWSGNLWAWSPQFGISQDLIGSSHGRLSIEGAMIDLGGPPSLSTQDYGVYTPPVITALSRWPGVQGRLAFESGGGVEGAHLGISGLYVPRRTTLFAKQFDSWAVAADLRSVEWHSMRLTGDVYTGSALGSLGGGAYKDFASTYVAGDLDLRALDDTGGWMQLQQKLSERLQFNEAVGVDNVPAHQLRPYAISPPLTYYNLARNRTGSANVIYSPNASVLFSLEYRRLASSYVSAPTQSANVIGLAAGYRF